MVNIIVAMSKNRVIGNDNKLIWRVKSDMKRFKELTTNNTVVMGRKTYDSIGRPLPNRRNIIITRNNKLEITGCEVVSSLEEALLLCNNNCFIIGGGEIYKQAIDISDRIYLTLIHSEFEGDTFFPEIDGSWNKIKRNDFESDLDNDYNYSFIDYERYEF